MEAKLRINRQGWRKKAIFLFFGSFLMATVAQAQILGLNPPIYTAQPVGTTVQNGDTVTLTASAYCTLGGIFTNYWVFSVNGKTSKLPTNATVTVTGLGTANITSTLTLKGVSSACAGTYYAVTTCQLLDGLLGLLTATANSQSATLSVTNPTVPFAGSTTQSGMVSNGFKVQFSAPIGSNVVIEACSNIGNWSPVYTNVSANGTVTFTDAAAKTASCRFYRARLK